jgi:HK97 family phage major capsid protein
MEASSKIKELLDELAGVLAEMGAVKDEDRSAEDEDKEKEEREDAAADSEEDEEDEDRAHEDGHEDEDEEDRSDKSEEDEDEAERMAEGKKEDADANDEEKEKKLRCLCSRAEKIKKKIRFYENLASKELELRSVLDKATPAGSRKKENRSVEIYHKMPGAGRLRNFKGKAAEERAYRAGQYFKATLLKDQNAARWCDDHGVAEQRALSESVNSQGGVFVNEEILNEIIVLVEEFGAFPKFARNIEMKSDTLVIPRRTGGLSAYFIGENTSVPDSDAAWDRVQLVAKKAAVSNRMSSEILEDSVIGLADYITGEIARAIAELIDTVGFVGTGSGDHGGIIGAATKIDDGNHAAGVITAATGNTGAGTLDVDDLVSTVGALPLYARGNAAWYVSPAVFAASVQRLGLVNNVGLAGGNTAADLASATELRLLGYPVRFVHTMSSEISTDPSVVKFLFGDLSMGAIYSTRRGLNLKTSADRYAELDQTLIVATTRFDCVTHDCGDATKAGPIVALKTAAS